MAVSMSDLKTIVQEQGDLVGDSHIGTAASGELERRVNFGYRRLWNLIRRLTLGEFFFTEYDFTIAAAAYTATMPAAFGRLIQLYHRTGSGPDDIEPLARIRLPELPVGVRGYRLIGGNTVRVWPASSAPGNYRVHYEAKYTELGTADNMDSRLEEWKEFVGVAGALGGVGKQDRATDELRTRLAELESEITWLVHDQDLTPDVIADVNGGVSVWPVLPDP